MSDMVVDLAVGVVGCRGPCPRLYYYTKLIFPLHGIFCLVPSAEGLFPSPRLYYLISVSSQIHRGEEMSDV